ncbi:Uu.00g101460.m01.CDS01 [Anthostomella pinea]|uniref:Uu.00g101460.m01.CDS01 n=1 Tax=Anthostomella pinea TaxID=933095 RepID=A0AAI8VE63_9PEZI|nr:Uu.00g101460.m01.CDS01 [Anthostomella pinea]
MASETRVPVLIVGGGIVGLSASLCLSQQGIKSLLVERHSGGFIHPRARGVNARTMEVFRRLGIEDRVREAGASLFKTYGIYSGHSLSEVIEAHPCKERSGGLPTVKLLASLSPTSGAFVTQDMLEPVLVNIAKERGNEIWFRTECVDTEQDGDGVTATLRDRETGTLSTVRADYLIAADGAGSPIRTRLDIPTAGRGSLGHLINILFRADLRPLVQGREFSICAIERPEVSGAFASINNSDRWVFQLLYDPSKGETPSDFPPERCTELLRLALGLPDVEIAIESTLPWEPTVRVAQRLQHGRVFLAGDAAHQMPPWGGQGANSGVADAHNLAWKLALVLRGQADRALLETYSVERQPVGQVAAEASGDMSDARGLISMKRTPAFVLRVARIARLSSGHSYSYQSRAVAAEDTSPLGGLTWRPWTLPSLLHCIDGRPGRRAPHLWVEHQGNRVSTLDLFGKNFVLLAGAEGAAWIEGAKKASEALGVTVDAYRVGPKGDLVVPEGQLEAAAGITARGAIVVRPDDFVAWRQRRESSDPHAELARLLRQVLCL